MDDEDDYGCDWVLVRSAPLEKTGDEEGEKGRRIASNILASK